jgi:hypothetical protein
MKIFLVKIKYYYRNLGIKDSFLTFMLYPFKKLKSLNLEKRIFKNNSAKDIFTEIYKTNYWGDLESKSGTGSSLKSTENIRKELPQIIKKLDIKSIVDIPCGDFYWFSKIINNLDIKYFGGDIVKDLINKNKKFESQNIVFRDINLITDKVPYGDLLICRDCLFHFSYNDINKVFLNLKSTDFKYILITNHNLQREEFENNDCITGSFRFLDFHLSPFNFVKNYEYEISDTDYPKTYLEKKILIYSKENFLLNIKNLF